MFSMYVVKFSKIYFLGFKHRSFQGIFFSEIVQFLKIFVLVLARDRAVGIGPSEHKECRSIPSEGYYTNVVTSNDITLSM